MRRNLSPESDGTEPEAVNLGRWSADRSPVDLYRLLRSQGEPEIIRSALRPGASVLELGCGVGRITHPLIRMGFTVIAVDNSTDMLEFVVGAEKVLADIETLNLNRKFDAVLLMSHFVNVPDVSLRKILLATCARHLARDGVALIQRYDPKWLANAEAGFLGNGAGVEAFLDRIVRRGPEVDVTIRWEAEGKTWTQSFRSRNVDEKEIQRALEEVGMRLNHWLDPRKTWFSAELRAV